METVYEFDIITTFRKLDQGGLHIFVKGPLNEERLVKTILGHLSMRELKELVKLSVCMMGSSVNVLPEFLRTFTARNGKYYFNVDVNDDGDTAHWNNVRLKAIEERHSQSLWGCCVGL